MFEISWSELLILAVVTLLFVGPKDLPIFLRTIGRYAGSIKRQAAEFRAQFDQAMREAEFAQMKDELSKMEKSVNDEVMGAKKTFEEAGAAAKFDPTSLTTPASVVASAQSIPMAGTAIVKPAETGQSPEATEAQGSLETAASALPEPQSVPMPARPGA